MKRIFFSILLGFIPLLTLGQTGVPDSSRCAIVTEVNKSCWTVIYFDNGQRYVGFVMDGKQNGEGILFNSNGRKDNVGIWENGNFIQQAKLSNLKFPFFDSDFVEFRRESKNDVSERASLEIERNRPPAQKIAFCVQTVQSSGTRYPSIDIPYCQDACNKTYFDRLCTEIGGSKWRVQTASPKTSPPNSQYFVGLGSRCACIGQEYVLNEIKETLVPSPAAVPAPASTVQADLREAELAKREKALADRERALLEAENKRLREELEAERKKKK